LGGKRGEGDARRTKLGERLEGGSFTLNLVRSRTTKGSTENLAKERGKTTIK